MIVTSLLIYSWIFVNTVDPQYFSQNRDFWLNQLKSPSADLRINALQKLEGIHDVQTVPLIAEILKDEKSEVRYRAIRTMSKIPTAEGLELLKSRLNEESDPYLKSEIKRSMRAIEDALALAAEKAGESAGTKMETPAKKK